MAVSKKGKLYIIIAFIVFVIIMFLCLKLENKNKVIESQNTYIEKLQKAIDYYKNLDSTYVTKRDSIEYNIIKKDSTIYKIREVYEKKKDSVLNSTNNDVVNKFNELVWAD
jgi:hypothetical protein